MITKKSFLLIYLLFAVFSTAFAAFEATDPQGQDNQTVWYNGKNFRCNIYINKEGELYFRNIYLFKGKMNSAHYNISDSTPHSTSNTLPIVDGQKWSSQERLAGLRLVEVTDRGNVPMHFKRFTVAENGDEMFVLANYKGESFTIILAPNDVTIAPASLNSKYVNDNHWALEMTTFDGITLPFTAITPRAISAEYLGQQYGITAEEGYFQQPTSEHNYIWQMRPENGAMKLSFTREEPKTAPLELNGNRFLTLCFMIRTTPWEVSRDVKLHPRDEEKWHTLESVTALREAFAKDNPDGRLTWGFTLNALEDQRENYKQIRQYAVECHYKYGDEISYFPGYFPVMYLPRERINREMHEAINDITAMVGNGYRPQCIMGGFLSSDNLKYLAEKEDIHVAHAVIWSQHAIDGGGAEGSVSYPYYPSTEHFCKPAQGKDDFIDCVSLDGWTMDFICARQSGQTGHAVTDYNSRRGVGPIETYEGMGLDLGEREVLHTEKIHYDRGYELNGFGWVTNIWETEMYHEFGPQLMVDAMHTWVGDIKKYWPDVHFITYGEFGELWRAQHKSNDFDYHFFERGSGIADSYNNLELRWFMNQHFRMALLRDWQKDDSPTYVIDFTRYDLPAAEPADATPENPNKDWSLMNILNQKQVRPQDQPKLLQELPSEDQELIFKQYPELRKSEEIL